MKPSGDIAGKGSKHDRRHKDAKPRKHDKLDKHEGRNKSVNSASLAFEQFERGLGGVRINHALLPTSAWPDDVFLAVASPMSGVGKRSTTLLNNGQYFPRVPPSSWRTSLVSNPLIRPISWPHPDEVVRGSEGYRAAAVRREVLTRIGHGIWQIDVTWKTGLLAGPVAEECGVTVLDWYTQKPLSSGHLAPWRADAAVAFLERLAKRKGVPCTLIMDHQPALLARVEQWAFTRGVMVVICQSPGSWRDRRVQMS
jgi:hypothetical protein